MADDDSTRAWDPAALLAVAEQQAHAARLLEPDNAVHVWRRTQGVQGVSQRIGAMYDWSWFLGFATLTAIMTAVQRAGAGGGVFLDTAALIRLRQRT